MDALGLFMLLIQKLRGMVAAGRWIVITSNECNAPLLIFLHELFHIAIVLGAWFATEVA